VAHGDDRHRSGGHGAATGGLTGGSDVERYHGFGAQSQVRAGLPLTIRGGGDPKNAMASMPEPEWVRRLGASPLKRMAASWSGSQADPTDYKVAAR
jgi:hypothetical protein